MLALRLTRVARPAVQLRRLAVVAASAGTGFLLLSSLAYALAHPEHSGAALLRLSWCAAPLAATVYLTVAVARTDPGTRPRTALSALGLGPGRLMAVSAVTSAVCCTIGCLFALLAFLHLRGDLTGLPLDGAASRFLAARKRLPVPGTLTLLATVPALASAAVAWSLRPREPRPAPRPGRASAAGPTATGSTADGTAADGSAAGSAATGGSTAGSAASAGPTAGGLASRAEPGAAPAPDAPEDDSDPHRPLPPHRPPTGLPWGVAVLAVGLTVEAYAGRSPSSRTALPGGLSADSAPVLVGWLLTALGLALAGPALTHLCGLLLQAVRPGAVRLLAGRVLMEEAGRIGRPLGVVCAVASGAYAVSALSGGAAPSPGPLTALGAALVAGCAVAVLLTAAVEARQSRAATIAALRRLGAPGATLRSAAALRAGALLALFVPLTLLIAALAALPLTR
ncbi:hypothetical protein A8713_22995 [Streptomyces sp. SAT1]|uniref:hypothetical protein n=1 Tax=Streptomyces sp. SAT1 TaxID=1849967 RepID=UPI0007DDE223|nr:hypothetical protein [Streptomyces sp. SAT1]ANH93682.1 hypothetical protein A8713_22995 [Streptomyces sp. SAT1]